MGKNPQPAKKSYFFDKGYKDLLNTIKGAWSRNFASLSVYRTRISDSWGTDGKIWFALKLILNLLAMLSVLVFGSIITLGITFINVVILLVFMFFVYIGFTFIWIVDRIYLTRNKIFTACHNCKEKSLIPTYICPECGAKHTNLTPGVYGILHRTCTGDDPDHYCGHKLPTTFFNGRKELEAECPHCGTALSDRESKPICIPVVGGRSVGKTAFITAFSKDFIDNVAPSIGIETEFYNTSKEAVYGEITQDYMQGSTRMTERPQDINQASSVSFSFFLKNNELKPERLVHVYDIAGEVFTDSTENEIQKQYEYCQGIVLMIDPFAIPTVRYAYEDQLSPEDIAGIGTADINGIIDSFLNKLREVTGLSDQKMSNVPIAVVISKIDSAVLESIVGDSAVKTAMAENPSVFDDYFNTMDYLCRKFLKENDMESFVNNVELKFKDCRYFACSAIGHTRDQGSYNPMGVLAPMQWLFSKADNKVAELWNEEKFEKKTYKFETIEKKLSEDVPVMNEEV